MPVSVRITQNNQFCKKFDIDRPEQTSDIWTKRPKWKASTITMAIPRQEPLTFVVNALLTFKFNSDKNLFGKCTVTI
jgi:hypothetical protein